MNFLLKESSSNEIFRLLSTNIDKIRILMKEPNYNSFIIKQFLSEFEYDLLSIYDILQENKYSYNLENYNSHIKNNGYLNFSERIRKNFNSNNFEEESKKHNNGKNKRDKKYSFTINILSDKYFDSKKKNNKKFNKSNSCKSYSNKSLNNIIKNLKKNIKTNNNKNKRDINNIINDDVQKYLTDYSFKKRNDNDESYNKFRTNINKNKASLKNLNTLYNHYDELLKKNNNQLTYNNTYNNTNYEYENKFDLDKNDINIDHPSNYRDKNILLSEENRYQNYYKNYNHMNYDYIKDYEKNTNYMKERTNKRYINNNDNSDIIKKIIIQIIDDGNILKELKKIYGNDIVKRLLNGELYNEEINDILLYLKKYDNIKKEKNLFRGSKYYRNYKYDNNNKNNDIFLLRNCKNNNKFNDFYNSDYNNTPLSD